MSVLKRAALFFTLSLAVASATAQTNSVSEHYRAYRAAIERRDLTAAEREGAAALAASEQRDGDGGATAVLALNLAQVRLDVGRGAEAVQPARRAVALAAARGADARIDPLLARLLLARAELAANESGAAERLSAALEAAAGGGYEEAGYQGARELALAVRHESVPDSLAAWDRAIAFAAAEERGLWRGEALIGRGDALMDLTNFGRYRATGSNIAIREDTRASDAFREAMQILTPLAAISAPNGALTRAQNAYATALAYQSVLVALQMSVSRDSDYFTGLIIDNMAGDGLPPCRYRIAMPTPEYPDGAAARWGVGGVTVRLFVNAAGEISEAGAVASVGGSGFVDAVNTVAPRSRIEGVEPTEGGCSPSVTMFRSWVFYIQAAGFYDAR